MRGELRSELNGKASINHNHTVNQITDFNHKVIELINENSGITYQKIGSSEIIKFPNGAMIQALSGIIEPHTVITSYKQNFPVAFMEKPKVLGDMKIIQDTPMIITHITQTGFIINPNNRSTNTSYRPWDVFAIGRWK